MVGGRYRLIAPLGEGGMATIWRAVDEQLDREVAVKLLRPQFGNDAGFAARFKQEARSAGSLSRSAPFWPCISRSRSSPRRAS